MTATDDPTTDGHASVAIAFAEHVFSATLGTFEVLSIYHGDRLARYRELAQAGPLGLDAGAFQACMQSRRHAAAIEASVSRMQQLGISGTPMVVMGLTPAPGQPMKIVKYVYGAQPFAAFKEAIDSLLSQ